MTKAKKSESKNVGVVEFARIKGKQVLYIKVDPEIEDLFRAETIQSSSTYVDENGKGLEYYDTKPDIAEIEEKFNSPMFGRSTRIQLGNYGTSFYRQGAINFSILRTVGISEGKNIVVDKIVIDNEVKQWMHDLAQFLKHLYINFIKKQSVRATINIEV